MRTWSLKAIVLSATLAVMGTSVTANASELRIGTASQGGAFYPIGQSISTLVNEHAEGLRMVPIVTGGSVQNPRLVNSGEVDMAITNNNLAILANKGAAMYKRSGAMDLKVLGPLHFSVLHMMALNDSSINSIADLKGKRVAVGPAGGGTINFLKQALGLYGMSMEDITPSFLSYGDGFSQLSDGNIDAAFALSGYPAGAVMQARVNKELKFISFSDEVMEKALQQYPNYRRVEIPTDVYDTAEAGVVLGVNNMLIVDAKMDDDKAYSITKAIYGHMDQFQKSNALAKQIKPESALSLGVPLHPGAQKFFEEK